MYAIDFLTRVGQKCTPTRQEFILLSDVFGVSMLVDAVNHREREGATETTVLGPFLCRRAQTDAAWHRCFPAGHTGERMFVQSRGHRSEGKPLANVRSTSGTPTDGLLRFAAAGLSGGGAVAARQIRHRRDGRFFFRTICRAATRYRPTVRSADDHRNPPSPDAAGACALPGQCARL